MDDLKLIKKHYGEKMMHLCRELFPTILENEGALFELMSKTFDYNKELYDDLVCQNLIDDFKRYIYKKYEDIKKIENREVNKSAKELLSEAGYDLYECKTEEDIQKFKKYYAKGEELCTFRGGRLNRCYVFFAVKKNVNDIKREDFTNPNRQDEYGTSVISIQFSKSDNYVSIKNRYNHTVSNPDATFSNNLDNIIKGLTNAFNNDYGYHINVTDYDFEIPGYVCADDGKFYKFNYEENGVYFCLNNVIIYDGYVDLDYSQKERYIFMDSFIVDLHEKKVFDYINDITLIECNTDFVKSVSNLTKIDVVKDKKTGNKTLYFHNDKKETVIVEINNENKIVSYINPYIKSIGDEFLYHNETITKIEIPNVERIGQNFLSWNIDLTSIYLPKLKVIKDGFLENNSELEEIDIRNVTEIGNCFLDTNRELNNIELPLLRKVGDNFLQSNSSIKHIDFPNLEEVLDNFMLCSYFKTFNLPKLKKVGSNFLAENYRIDHFESSSIEEVGSNFLFHAINLKNISLPKAKVIGRNFLLYCNDITSVSLQEAQIIKSGFLSNNKSLTSLNLPNVLFVGSNFLDQNEVLNSLNMPSLEKTSGGFLRINNGLKSLCLPSLRCVGPNFLTFCTIEEINLPSLEYIDDDWFLFDSKVKRLNIPKLKEVGENFLYNACYIEQINAESLNDECIDKVLNEYIKGLLKQNALRLRRK